MECFSVVGVGVQTFFVKGFDDDQFHCGKQWFRGVDFCL